MNESPLDCYVGESIFRCQSNLKLVSKEKTIEILNNENREAKVLFVTDRRERVICSGINFVEHVWGKERATLWILPRGKSICFKDEFVMETISPGIYFVSRNKAIPDNLINKSEDLKRLMRYISALTRHDFKVLFIVDSEIELEHGYLNIIPLKEKPCIEESLRNYLNDMKTPSIVSKLILFIIKYQLLSESVLNELVETLLERNIEDYEKISAKISDDLIMIYDSVNNEIVIRKV